MASGAGAIKSSTMDESDMRSTGNVESEKRFSEVVAEEGMSAVAGDGP